MNDDDFEDDAATDIQVEQRHYDRNLTELYNSGYRDAYQNNMENEAYLQKGFNFGYSQFSKTGLLIGSIYSLLEKYKFSNFSEIFEGDRDLIKLKDLLKTIEEQILNYDYELAVKRMEESSEINSIMDVFNSKLKSIEEYLINYNPENKSSSDSLVDLSNNLSELLNNNLVIKNKNNS